jgi:competence ComEA-like helix-hairpin-helix protein
MAWRSFTIRVPLILCLLFGTAAFAKKKPPAQPVNINTANSDQLQTVPGIGPATAGKILQMRKSYGAFKSVDDLLAIRGLGPKRLEKMRKYLTVGKDGPKHGTRPAEDPPPNPTRVTASPPKTLIAPFLWALLRLDVIVCSIEC